MSLVSLKFIGFSILTAMVYFLVPKKYRWMVLLSSSILFYMEAGKRALFHLGMASLFVFLAGIYIERSPVKTKKRKFVLIASVLLLAGWLAAVKTAGSKGWGGGFLFVPLGISYFSFSLISYLADVYWEKEEAVTNFLKFLTYVLFFPKILQGPITRHKDLAAQINEGGNLTYKNVCFGTQRMIYGYFKKMVIADRAALFTNTVFAQVSQYSGSVILVASFIGAFQLYCDFSGYMDIVLGFTQILGIRMDENFDHPFFSRGAAEFWRKWHITLGSWFRDYVYTPVAMSHSMKRLGRWSRKNINKRVGNSVIKLIALSAVWLLTGLWHGTGWNYILWGGYWGSLIIFSTIFEPEILKLNRNLHVHTNAASWHVFQRCRTFVIFSFGIMITQVSSLYEIKLVVYKIVKSFQIWNLFDGTLYSLGLNRVNFNIFLVSLFLVGMISLLQEQGSLRERIGGLNALVRWGIYAIALSSVLFLGIYGEEYGSASFAYEHF